MEITRKKHIGPETDLYAAHFLHEEIQGVVNDDLAERGRTAGIDPLYHDATAPEDSWYEDAAPAYRIYSVVFCADGPDEAYERALEYIAATSDEEGEWYYFGDGCRQYQRHIGLLELDAVPTPSKELPQKARKEAVHLSIVDWANICGPNGKPIVPPKEELALFKEFKVVR